MKKIRRGMMQEGDITTTAVESPYQEGDLAIWDSYYDQSNPLVIFKDGDWCNMNVDMLIKALKGE